MDALDDGRFVLQREDCFRFGTDAVQLARFTKLRPRERVIDLGAGCGILSLLLIDKAPGLHFTALEIQRRMYALALRSVSLNGLDGRITVLNADLRDAPKSLGYGAFDAAVANPPYDKPDAVWPIGNESHRVARYEVMCTLEDVATSASRLLRNGGRLYMIHRAGRCLEVLDTLRNLRLEPKTLRFVHATAEKQANFMLVEGIKLASPGLNVLPPVLVAH